MIDHRENDRSPEGRDFRLGSRGHGARKRIRPFLFWFEDHVGDQVRQEVMEIAP